MKLEAILLDIGGTVFDWRTAVTDAAARLNSSAERISDPEAFSRKWRKQSLIEIDAVAKAAAAWRSFDRVLESSLRETIAACRIFGLTADEYATLLQAWETMPAWPEVPQAIAQMRAEYFVAPHTILSLRAAAFSSKRAGVSWDAIISCDGLGATKPNPASYARALETIGRAADKVLFVAAHPSDLRAARAHGMRTAYVTARLHDFGDDYEDTGFAAEFDLVAADFGGLAVLLGA